MKRLFVCYVCPLVLALAQEPFRETSYATSFGPPVPVPWFHHGRLIERIGADKIIVYGTDGSRAWFAQIEGSYDAVSVTDAAAHTDGRVAVSFAYRDKARRLSGAISIYDRQGTLIRTISTGYYVPGHLCFTTDGTLWSSGEERTASDGVAGSTFSIFRTFSAEGKEISRFVQRHEVPLQQSPGHIYHGLPGLQAAKDRMGALISRSNYTNESHWLEVDFKGRVLGVWSIGDRSHVAFTADGNLYSTRRVPDREQPKLEQFDRATSSWVEVDEVLPLVKSRWGIISFLIGADGDSVVAFAGPPQRLLWFQVE